MRLGYKHYKNCKVPGRTTFFTTTILDFAMVFAEPFNADLMAASLLDDLRFYGAQLWAFVVMGHHIHLLAAPHEDMTPSTLMERVKGNSGKRLMRHLSDEMKARLASQQGLNQRTIWKVGFRSVPITTERMFLQKMAYIHQNPVRAGLCERPEDYRWSSSWMCLEGNFDWERGISIDDELVSLYCDGRLLDLRGQGII